MAVDPGFGAFILEQLGRVAREERDLLLHRLAAGREALQEQAQATDLVLVQDLGALGVDQHRLKPAERENQQEYC